MPDVGYIYNLWTEAFEHYGSKCVDCGEADRTCLTIGHKNNDGRLHRRAIDPKHAKGGFRFLGKLKAAGWPKYPGLVIQCANCQLRDRRRGVTP